MSGVVIPRRTNTRPNISIRRSIPSFDRSNPVKAGAGATSMSWSSIFDENRSLAAAATRRVAGHLRHAAHVDTGGGQDAARPDSLDESLVECHAARQPARPENSVHAVWRFHV